MPVAGGRASGPESCIEGQVYPQPGVSEVCEVPVDASIQFESGSLSDRQRSYF
jgi:hypothetical protein